MLCISGRVRLFVGISAVFGDALKRGPPLKKEPILVQLFFPSAPGVEPFLVRELKERFAGLKAQEQIGGVLCEAKPEQVPALCLGVRRALGAWWRFANFPARHFGQLQKGLAKQDLNAVLGEYKQVHLKVTSKRSRLYHSKAIAQRFFESSGRSLAPEDEWAPTLHLRIFRDQASLSVDLVGGLLPKRGWRKETAKAPLRKDLAAMLLAASGWQPGAPLVDPMCGSGTLLIEAARASAGYWPNGLRTLDLCRLCAFGEDPLSGFEANPVMPAAQQGAWPAQPSVLLGMDRQPGALEISARNEARAQVSGITWQRAEVGPKSRWSLPEGAFVVCNPPFGQRVGHKKQLVQLYAQLGRLVKEAGAASRFACISVRGPWVQALDLDLQPVVATDFGGQSVTIYSSSVA